MKNSKRTIKRAVMTPIGKFLNIHTKSDKPDVFIFSVGRSGSTWLMEIIHSQKEFKYSNEPLWNLQRTIRGRLLPLAPGGKYIHVEEEGEANLLEFFHLLLDDRIQVSPPWNVFSPDYSFLTQRYVVKILHGTSLINWLSGRLDIKSIFLIRHPIPRALAKTKRHGRCFVHTFMNNDYFREQYLDKAMIQGIDTILAQGTGLEKQVLSWCLENLVPLRSLEDKSWLVLTYEELVLNPMKTVDYLCEELELSDPQRMYRHIEVPSASASKELRQHLKVPKAVMDSRRQIAQRWKKEVTSRQERKMFDILKLLNIDAYSCGESLARRDLINFDDTCGWI